jgi:hypothetical protein
MGGGSMNVFITAYACDPALGSEAQIGWNLVEQVSGHNRVRTVTRASKGPRHQVLE